MSNWKIPLFKIYWDKEDIKLTTEAIKKGMHWAIGPNVKSFEKKLSKYIGTKYSVVFNSGTSALHATLLAHKIDEGSEIIVPSFTFIATANAPLFVGAKPVFADIEEKSFGLDPEDVKEKITKKTKAIIPIHYGGCPSKIKELKEIADDHKIILIEDAAESFGAKIKESMVGTFGESSMFSFCANKIISTGEGGAVTTESKDIFERLKLIRSHGRLETEDYFSSANKMDYVSVGYNLRMSNITAALGISQINKADKIIDLRRIAAKFLNKKLSGIDGVYLPVPPSDHFHVYQLYTIRVNFSIRDDLKAFLINNGIMSQVYFEPVHHTYFYKKVLRVNTKLPMTEKLSKEVLSLPMYPSLIKKEMEYISAKINEFISGDVDG